METAAFAIFDPYHKWLGIRDYRGAANHYRLLGIDLFETDDEVIRDAALRQMTQLKTYCSGANRDLCNRIIDEVAQARAVLLDPERRTGYDRELKLKAATAVSNSAAARSGIPLIADLDDPGENVLLDGFGNGPAPPRSIRNTGESRAVLGSGGVECHACGIENPSARQFCSGCGARLWEPCLKCMKLNAGREKHCGTCGTNLLAQLQQFKDALRARFDEAELLAAQHEHLQAIDVLLDILLPDHSALAKYAERQRDTLARLRCEMESVARDRDSAIQQGRELLAAHDLEQAALVLEAVPEPYRNDDHRALLDQVRSKQIEVLTLEAEIRGALAEKHTEGLLPKVEELLSIKPDHFQARQLRDKLLPLAERKLLAEREGLYKKAAAQISRHNYSTALSFLEQIPEASRTPQIVKMVDDVRAKAAETEWLADDLREAVVFDNQLLPIAERLLKLRPADKEAAGIASRLHYQAAHGPIGTNGHAPFPRPPRRSVWGPPLEGISGFTRIDTAVLKDESLSKSPDRFCVAAGLALGGLGRSTVQINLAPPVKDGLLGGLFKPRKRPTTSAWGIDVGRASLKAIKLRFDADSERIVAERAICIDHGKLLNQADAQPDELLNASLQKLLKEANFAGSVVCVSLPAQKVLFRPIALPIVDDKKVPDLMKYEAKQQIPFPIEEVAWDYQVLNRARTEVDVVRDCEVLLTALRLEDARVALAPFAESQIKVDVLQSDATALLNFYLYEAGLPSAKTRGADTSSMENDAGRDVTVLLDVGTDCSNLLVTNARSVVVRSIPVGGNAFSRALVKEFQLTFAQAEKLKRNPTAVRELHRLYAALEPRLLDLVRETHRTVDTFLQRDSAREVKRFIVVGGAAKLHGVLRRLWYGAPNTPT
jgi:type IV pilus assembly protein PilM